MKAILFCTIFLGLIYPKISNGQAPNLGTATGFALFTSVGAVTNTSVTTITGNIGTNAGALTGFGSPTTVNGILYVQDDTTAQATLDLQTAYNQLFNTTTTIPGHAPAFGTETITAGVYGIGGAGSVTGNLTLDAQGDANAVFIFKFTGALTVAAGSNLILANGALAGNVFWIAEGAISMAANITMKGTLIAHDAANSIGTSSNLEGRMFSTAGAINVNTNTVTKPTSGGYIPLPIHLLSFTGVCTNQNIVLNWSTATETNNQFFTIERSDNTTNWDIITKVDGAHNSSVQRNYSYTDQLYQKGNCYYRLKQTDMDGVFKYGPTIYIKNCGDGDAQNIKIYPNPGSGKFKLLYTGNRSKIQLTQIINAAGEKIYETKGYPTNMDLSNQTSGLYYLRLHIDAAIITKKIIIIKE